MATKPYAYIPSNPGASWPPGIDGYYIADPRNPNVNYDDVHDPYKYTLDFNIKHGLYEGNPGFRYAKVEDAQAALTAGHWSYLNQADLATFYQGRDDIQAIRKEVDAQKQTAKDNADAIKAAKENPFGGLDKSKDPRDYENPPFDPRILRIWNPEGGRFYRGYMQQSQEYTNPTGRMFPRRVNFLYNPSTITVRYSSSIIGFDPSAAAAAGDTGTMLIPNMQETTFALFFDRTYEVAGIRHPHRKMASWQKRLAYGVRADVMALEEMVGIRDGQGPILRIPLNLCFGLPEYTDDPSQESINAGPVGPDTLMRRPIKQFGWVSGMDVQYTHFANNMTPVRAVVNITFTHQIKGRSNADVQEGATSTAGTEVALQ